MQIVPLLALPMLMIHNDGEDSSKMMMPMMMLVGILLFTSQSSGRGSRGGILGGLFGKGNTGLLLLGIIGMMMFGMNGEEGG